VNKQTKKKYHEQRIAMLSRLKQELQIFINKFSKDFIKKTRRRYLRNRIKELTEEIEEIMEKAGRMPEEWLQELVLEINDIDKKIKKRDRFRQEYDWPWDAKDNGITDREIELANNADLIAMGVVEPVSTAVGRAIIHCPFHDEKTPSMVIYPHGKGFYCFGCAQGGDNITFIMKLKNMTFPQAVRFLL